MTTGDNPQLAALRLGQEPLGTLVPDRDDSVELAALNAEIAAVAMALAKTGRRFARERRAIAAGDPATTAGAALALRHFVNAEVERARVRLYRIVRRLGVADRAA